MTINTAQVKENNLPTLNMINKEFKAHKTNIFLSQFLKYKK